MLTLLTALTALAMSGTMAGDLAENLSRLTHLSPLYSLALQHAEVQVNCMQAQ